MSDDLLDAAREIERLADKATPRPWGYDLNGTIARVEDAEWEETVCRIPGSNSEMDHDDAAYIVAACNHAPALARALVEQAERIKELESDLSEFGRHSPGCSAEHGDQYRCRCGWRERSAALAPTLQPFERGGLTVAVDDEGSSTPRTYDQGVRDAIGLIERAKKTGNGIYLDQAAAALSALLPAKEANGELGASDKR